MSVTGLQRWVLVGVLTISSALGHAEENTEVTSVQTKSDLIEELQRPAPLKQEYMYRSVNGGIEIHNGERRFNRPLYSTVQRRHRLIALAGDRPEFMLMKISRQRA